MTTYTWTDNTMRSGSTCDVDKVADNLMHLKYSNISATPFTMNSGNVNSNGVADLLSYSGLVVSTKTGGTYSNAVGTNAQGEQVTLSTANTLNMSGYSDGTYNAFVKADGTLEAFANTIYRQPSKPTGTFTPYNLAGNYINTGCTISGNIATGVSGKYLYTNAAVPLSTANNWELDIPYTHTSTPSTLGIICYGDYAYKNISLEVTSSNVLGLELSSNGSTWNIGTINSAFTLVVGTTYNLKIGFDGAQYYMKYNTDGSSNYTTIGTITNSAKVYSSTVMYFLNTTLNTTFYATGSIDLSKTKFILNSIAIKPNYIWLNTSQEPLTAKIDNNGALVDYTGVPIGTVSVSGGAITSVTTNSYNQNGYVSNSSTIAKMGMPSGRVINLALGTSGLSYTAPANGYYYINKSATAGAQYVIMANKTCGYNVLGFLSQAFMLTLMLPVRKDDVVSLEYNAAGATNAFQFFYAEGEV